LREAQAEIASGAQLEKIIFCCFGEEVFTAYQNALD
jgi:hypothetical protein